MEYFLLNNGQKIPKIGMGTSRMNDTSIIEEGLKAGYQMIDTALIYQNEELIGNAVKKSIKGGTIKREDVFIISKLLNSRHKKEDVLPQIKKSLKNLQLDYLDLYLIHFPFSKKVGSNDDECMMFNGIEDIIPLEETWRGMEECVRLGLTKGIGFCNFNSQQIDRILKIATIKPVVNEVECNPYFNQEKLSKFCAERNILIIGFSPFYSYNKPLIETHGLNLFEESIIKGLAEKYKKSMGNIVLRYLIQHGVVPIPKTDKIYRLKENIKIFDFALSGDDMEKMKSLNNNKRCINIEYITHYKEYPFNIEY